MAEVNGIKQKLHLMLALNRLICERCCDGFHFQRCLGHECQCACRDPQPARRPKHKRDRNGLTEEERRDQTTFPFDSFEPIEL